ncbi:hypothetical protein [Joostella sp.]|uniref:hypothetical protein n=1 Tax=Joostella sp. TaxID=2231138 RepID=UPI003A8FE60B
MKNKLLLTLILTIILSCSSDSDDSENSNSNKTSELIIGSWRVSREGKINTSDEEVNTKYYNPECSETWNIYKDGTFIKDLYKINDNGECILYNSYDDRNWIEFEDGQISFYYKNIDPYDSFNDSRPIITFKENNTIMRIKTHVSYENSIKYNFTEFNKLD